ncbi:LPS O-antigen chain length determinant protein WzzB [Pseudomonas vranovensis]|uniref:Chain-length determining protein n=1 Tax=Pseudomonas vranovensis TaxID=321661 RepID=A0A423D4K6_9PSED|nr:Wzz/FepE/Etk N-terminal domain-containing protein [Pseudomonas vranovensis]ROL66490.1 chain-length determining protein [Pseudomonas vranovensis]
MRNTPESNRLDPELDVLELLGSLWAKKLIILSVMFLAVLAAVIYLFIAKPVYETRVFVIPPTQNGIADFNYGRTAEAELKPYSVKDVYEVFLRDLQAESLRRSFFEEFYLPSLSESERAGSQTRLYEKFSRELVISPSGKDSPDRYSLTVQGEDPQRVVAWAKTYVMRAGDSAREEMIKNVTREAEVRARNLAQQIDRLREGGQKVREDLIVQLREALNVARAIGLKEPPIISGNLSTEVSAGMDGHLSYMRGTKALEAEIQNLEQRRSDDPFITRLRDLQARYAFYMSVEVNPESVAVFRIDGPIEQPDSPIKPRKSVVLAMAALAGLLLGVGYVLLAAAMRRRPVRPQ